MNLYLRHTKSINLVTLYFYTLFDLDERGFRDLDERIKVFFNFWDKIPVREGPYQVVSILIFQYSFSKRKFNKKWRHQKNMKKFLKVIKQIKKNGRK